ncbi:MAG: DUF4175 domain-containing protein, partial [Kiritimatiellae bacterium]|nr:DUF4175 domain-containing protein [Kiritimatiellia bacterium]
MRKSERINFPYGLSGDFARLLRKYDRLRRFLDILRDASLMTVALGSFILAACLFDRFVDVAGYWRAPLPWMALAVFLFFMGRMVLRVTRSRDYDNIAHTLDRLSGDRYDHLRSLLDFARRGLSATFFLTRVQTCAAHHWQGKNTRQFIDKRPVRRIAVWAGVTLALTAALWNVPYSRADLLLRRFLNPLGNYMRPSATWFDVQPLPATPVYSGDDLTIGARLCGRKVKKPVPLIKIVNEDGSTITRNMEPTPDNGWQVPLKNLQKSFVWYLCVDDARSARYKAPVLSRPAIVEAIVTYEYPKYSGLKKKTETLKGRAITALDGTKVMLKIRSNIALSNAIGRFEDDTVRFRINRKNSREAVVYQIVNKNKKMKPELISSTGVASKQELPFIFRVVPDSSPSINWRTQLNGKTFYLTDLLKISYRAEDDLGLASVELRVEDARRSQLQDVRLIDLDMEQYGSRVAEGETSLPVAELHREKINSLRLTLVARDTKDQEGLSRGATITIATDSFDRQLRGAIQYYSREGFMRGQNAVAYHAGILKRLKLVKSNLMILEDTLKAGSPLSDQHKELVKKINEDLGAIQLPSLYGTHWFFNIQHASLLPRFRDCLEYASVWSCLAVNGEELRENVTVALSSPNAKSAIQKLTPFLDENIVLQEKTAARVTADYAMLARELAGYLAASMEFQIKNAENGKLHDENFLLNARTALGEICDLSTNVLASETPPEYLQKLAGYLAENENEDGMLLREVLPALAGFKKALMPKTREAI